MGKTMSLMLESVNHPALKHFLRGAHPHSQWPLHIHLDGLRQSFPVQGVQGKAFLGKLDSGQARLPFCALPRGQVQPKS